MNDFYDVTFNISLFVLMFGLTSRILKERLNLSEPFIAITWGIIIGPCLLNVLQPSYFKSKYVLFYFAKFVLCIQTMSCGIYLPRGYIIKCSLSLFVLVVLVGFIKYLITFVIIYCLTPYNALVSFGISAALTPTDPVLSAAILKSRFADDFVPERLRLLLSAESGINDGFGLLLLFIPIDLVYNKDIYNGLLDIILCAIVYKCIISAILGIIIGYIARKALFKCYKNNMVGLETFLIYGVALAFCVMGLMEMLKMSELVCIFFTGVSFAWDEWFVFETRESKLQEVTDSLVTITFFVFLGTNIDFSKYNIYIGLCGVLIICIRRPLACLLMYPFISEIRDKGEALFIGWFGPIGVGALYYSLYLDHITNTVTIDIVGLIVFMSVVVHGLTIPFLRLESIQKLHASSRSLLPMYRSD